MVDQNQDLDEWRRFMQEFIQNAEMRWVNTVATTQTLTTVMTDDYLTPFSWFVLPATAPGAAAVREAETQEEKKDMVEKKELEPYLEASPEMVERMREAMTAGRVKTLIKEAVEAAGGVVVECLTTHAVVSTAMAAMIADPAWRMSDQGSWRVDGATDEEDRKRREAQARLMADGFGSYETGTGTAERWIRGAMGYVTREQQRRDLRGMLVANQAAAVRGEDAAGVWEPWEAGEVMGAERELKTLPKFILVVPTSGPFEVAHLTESPGELVGLFWRFAKHEEMFHPQAGRVAKELGAGRLLPGMKEAVGLVDASRVFDRWMGHTKDTVPAMVGGWPGVGIAVSQPALQATVDRRTVVGEKTAVLFAMILERVLKFGAENPTPWGEMKGKQRSFLLSAMNLRLQKKEKEERKRAVVPVADLAKLQAIAVAELEENARAEAQRARALRRDVEVAERRAEAAEKWKSGEGMRGLERAVEEGKIKAAYVQGANVWLVMPPIRVTSRKREWRGVVYEAGMYELPELWLCVPMPPRPETMRAFVEDGGQHPHPHVYARRGGEICWGRTNAREAGAEWEQHWGEMAVDALLTNGWGEFAETIRGFFTQFHDDGVYTPLCTIGKFLGTIEEVRRDGDEGTAADPPDGR